MSDPAPPNPGDAVSSPLAWNRPVAAPLPETAARGRLDEAQTQQLVVDGDRSRAESGDGTGGGRSGRPQRSKARKWLTESIILVVAAVGLALLIKTFAFQAFYIPSGSMEPTLHVEDRVIVNKLSYDFHNVNRGDIVVFDAPPKARSAEIQDLVKRVIGLPGDVVTFRPDGTGPCTTEQTAPAPNEASCRVWVNDRLLKEPYLPKGTPSNMEHFDGNVPQGCGEPPGGMPGCVVPKGRVFVMGDNRTASKDSRDFGPIKTSSIIGRVFLRIWPIDHIGFL